MTHKLQEILFARVAASRPVSLSLEMFETDVQHVIDEYLGGLLREQVRVRVRVRARAGPDERPNLRPDPGPNPNPNPDPDPDPDPTPQPPP